MSHRKRPKPFDSASFFQGEPGPLQRIVRDQRVLFILVGGINTLAVTALFAVLVSLYGDQVPATLILVMVWVVSLLAVFVTYRRLVFRVQGRFWSQLGRFTLVNLATLLVNAGLMAIFADYLRFPAIPVQLSVMFILVVLNYFGHMNFSFANKNRS